jgi:hypothetical protein
MSFLFTQEAWEEFSSVRKFQISEELMYRGPILAYMVGRKDPVARSVFLHEWMESWEVSRIISWSFWGDSVVYYDGKAVEISFDFEKAHRFFISLLDSKKYDTQELEKIYKNMLSIFYRRVMANISVPK